MGVVLMLLAGAAAAQNLNCLSASDIDAGAKNYLDQTGQQYFRMSAAGDYAGLKASSIPSLASNFGGVETAVTDHKADFAGAQATEQSLYVLEAPGSAPVQRAEFYCGIFNSADRVLFVIPNLPAGRYAILTQGVTGGKQAVRLTTILFQQGNKWLLAGYTVKPERVAGHDVQWYLQQARQYKSRGQNFAAYLYYLEAWDLSQPVDIEYTSMQDKLGDEMERAKPPDWPSQQQPMNLMAGGKTYRITQLFPAVVGSDLDLIIKYVATTDVSNTAVAFQDNMAVIKAAVTRYPELRELFGGVVARAVDPSSGRDYGTLLAMKDVK
ncbi:MAG: hypothetical protein ACR2IF_13325 [Terriglobales bacterium]